MSKDRITSLIIESIFELLYSSGGFPLDKVSELDSLIHSKDSHLALENLKQLNYGSAKNRQSLISGVINHLAKLGSKYKINLQTIY